MAKPRYPTTELSLEETSLLPSTVTAINAELKGKGTIAMAWFIRCSTQQVECAHLVVTGAGKARQFKVAPKEKRQADSLAVSIHQRLYCK